MSSYVSQTTLDRYRRSRKTWGITATRLYEARKELDALDGEIRLKDVFLKEEIALARGADNRPLYPNEVIREAEFFRRRTERYGADLVRQQELESRRRDLDAAASLDYEALQAAKAEFRFVTAHLEAAGEMLDQLAFLEGPDGTQEA